MLQVKNDVYRSTQNFLKEKEGQPSFINDGNPDPNDVKPEGNTLTQKVELYTDDEFHKEYDIAVEITDHLYHML